MHVLTRIGVSRARVFLPFSPSSTFGVLVLLLSLPVFGVAAPGALDPTFGGDGKVVTPVTSGFAFSVALQTDGRILVGGVINNDFGVARYLPNGSLDTSFNGTGTATVDFASGFDGARSVLLRGDGKIILVGSATTPGTDTSLAQLLPNGTLDLGFNGDGKSSFSVSGNSEDPMAGVLQSDGKVVVCGTLSDGTNNRMFVSRFKADGDPDAAGFGLLGANIAPFAGDSLGMATAMTGDNRILVVGTAIGGGAYDLAVARFTSAGAVDNTFGGGTGGASLAAGPGDDIANAVALQPDGKILVAGNSKDGSLIDRIAVGRFLANGTADPTFGTGGLVLADVGPGHDRALAVAIQPDGKILVFGRTDVGAGSHFVLLRLLGSGRLDPGFGLNGIVKSNLDGSTHSGDALALQPDGKIVGVGSLGSGKFGLARFKVAQGDMRIGGSITVPVGDNRYNLTGVGQTQALRIRSRRSLAHIYAAQNDSSRPDRLGLQGTRGNGQISVIYRTGGVNITAAVLAGTHRTPMLGAGRMQFISASFTSLGRRPFSQRFHITARSVADAAALDRAFVHVTGGL